MRYQGGIMKNFPALLIVATFVALFLAACSNDADLTPDQLVEKYSEKIKSNPRDAAAYSKRAAAYYFGFSKYDMAFEDADKAISLNPKDDNALAIRGQTYRLKEDYDNAARDFEEAIKLNPKNAEAFRGRGQIYYAQSELDNAITEFDKSIAADSKYYLSYIRRGDVYLAKEDDDNAARDFEEAIKLNPKNAEAFRGRGRIYHKQNKLDNALKDYDQAIQINPNDADVYFLRGMAYYNKEQDDLAIADYKKGLEIDPDLNHTYFWLGEAYLRKSDNFAAITNFTKATEFDYRVVDVYFGRGITYLNTGDNDKAIQDYNRVFELLLELEPDNSFAASAYNNRGTAYLNKAEYAKALADYNKAFKLDPKNEIAANNIKRVATVRAENQRKAAEAQREKYLAQFPSVTDAALLGDYRNNAVAARQKWQGKRILVSGKIISIREDMIGRAYITFVPGFFSGLIACNFTENNRNAVLRLNKGSEIRLLGTVGSHNTMRGGDIRVDLNNCSIVE
jgi:tetratricopeptide (TPR) repeat protein